jgi:hypothetical protein
MALHERTFLQRASKRASARARAGWLAGVVWCGVVWCGGLDVVDCSCWIAGENTHSGGGGGGFEASKQLHINKQTNKQTNRQTDRQTDRQPSNQLTI